MQRADKFGLIVASVLVVLLAAGAGFLVLKRNETLAKERPADASVKLTQLDDTSTLPPMPASAPAKQPEPVMPVRPKGYDFGFVTLVASNSDGVYLKWDAAELLTGSEADLYAKKNGAVINTQLYYIANETKKNKTYDVAAKALIIAADTRGATSTVSAADFSKQWNAGGPIRKRPWFIFTQDGTVTRMVQVVLPEAAAQ